MTWRAFVATRRDRGVGTSVEDLGDDELPPGEVLVDVEWSSVNYKDAMVTQPGNRVARLDRIVPGIDVVGRVVESAAPSLEPGTAVLAHGYDIGVARHGGFATRARVPAQWVVPLPPELSSRHAATIGTAGFTAVLSVDRLRRAGVTPGGGPVLVTGASGGVGSTAVAALARQGYEVVASTGKDGEHDYLRALGASQVVSREALAEDGGRVLAPERWAAAVDCVGGWTLAAVLRSLRYGGAVAASGLTAGSDLRTTVYPFIVRGASLLGIDSVLTPIEERRRVWASIGEVLPGALLDDMVSGETDLAGLAHALESVLHARVTGRVLVRPSA